MSACLPWGLSVLQITSPKPSYPPRFLRPPGKARDQGNPFRVPSLRTDAEQGDADAQVNLGVMYAIGLGVPQDDAEAVRWYRLSADQGNACAK